MSEKQIQEFMNLLVDMRDQLVKVNCVLEDMRHDLRKPVEAAAAVAAPASAPAPAPAPVATKQYPNLPTVGRRERGNR